MKKRLVTIGDTNLDGSVLIANHFIRNGIVVSGRAF